MKDSPGHGKTDTTPPGGPPRPATGTPSLPVDLTEMFAQEDIQRFHQTFAQAFGIASVILDSKGKPITDYVGFSDVLAGIERHDGFTFLTCMMPSFIDLSLRPLTPSIQQCPKCGLLYGIVPIKVGDRRLAHWLVGQVLEEGTNIEAILERAQAAGVDREEYLKALNGLPHMTRDSFERICGAISLSADQLSRLAIQNIRKARDLKARKEAERQLNFTQAVVDQVVDCIYWLDKDARIIYVNEAVCRTTGYTREELLSMTILDIDPRLTPELWVSHWEQKKAAGSLLFESFHRAKDGRIYPVEVSASYLVFEGQELNCTFVRDITERRKVEEELLLTRFTVDRAAAIILWLGENGRILYANDEACRVMRYDKTEILKLFIHDIDPEFPPPVWKEHWEQVRVSGTVVFESAQKRKDGSFYPVEIKGSYIEYGNVGYISSIAFDLSERKKTEELLQMTSFSVDQSAIPTYWLSMRGATIRTNRAARDSLGYTEEEMLTMNVREWDEDFPYDRWKEIGAELKLKHSLTMESKHKRKDGTKYPVEIDLNYMEYGGNEYVFAFAHDISERKKAEKERKRLQAQLLQSQKMEAIGQLAGGIAHDFNNILTALIGYGNILEMEMAEEDPLRTYVEEILAASERAANLTQNLLAFSRKQAITLKHHDINDVISGVEKLLRRLLPEDIDLIINLAEAGTTVMADITQIQQVLINLATNARDAMPEGGSLTIEVCPIPRSDLVEKPVPYDGSAYARISVSDTGHGMDRTVLERIFDPFFTTKDVGKGTGLGLSLAYGIVKQHKGFISVTSEKNAGTTFHIFLPMIEEKSVPTRTRASLPRNGTGTILLAEDDAEVRRLAKNVLTRTGYRVIEAADGQDALDAFMANAAAVDLIIIDVVMPRKNGKEVIDEIKSVRPGTKVLFTSGYTRDIISEKGLAEPGLNFLAKPLTPQELLEKVREIMGS